MNSRKRLLVVAVIAGYCALCGSGCGLLAVGLTEAGGETTYRILEHKRIQIRDSSGTLADGEMTVFEYGHVEDHAWFVTDDEHKEWLRFEIDPGLDRFEFRDAEIQATKCFYSEHCDSCGEDHFVAVGTLQGERLSPTTWWVRADVVLWPGEPREEQVVIDHTFTRF